MKRLNRHSMQEDNMSHSFLINIMWYCRRYIFSTFLCYYSELYNINCCQSKPHHQALYAWRNGMKSKMIVVCRERCCMSPFSSFSHVQLSLSCDIFSPNKTHPRHWSVLVEGYKTFYCNFFSSSDFIAGVSLRSTLVHFRWQQRT